MNLEENKLPAVTLVEPDDDAPVKQITAEDLRKLGEELHKTFQQYASDRRLTELKWVRSLRQYLGIYDPEIEKELGPGRSRAYPRITRVKCISVLSRIMNLMFPGNERNWTLKASPSADMKPEDVKEAIDRLVKAAQAEGTKPEMTFELVEQAVQDLANERADRLALVLDDQLQELGGDQTLDYVSLNRKVAQSGIMYGLGVLRGPFVREFKTTKWTMGEGGMPQVVEAVKYRPQYEFLPVWDFYPDMSAKTFANMDGYYVRMVMSKPQVRALGKRPDFFKDQITDFLKVSGGNYKPREFETELRTMGVREAVNDQKALEGKYEVIIWNGPVSGNLLAMAGVDVDPDKRADDIEAEVWMLDGKVIKADINQWRKIGVEVEMIHTFLFDEDDTSPVGNGLPNVVRDSQMSVAASARMLLDNASVVCGPNMEINTELMRPDQDLTSISAYKMWYREGTGLDAQWPAIREININGHLSDLKGVIDTFMQFADAETFVGPATGGDMAQAPSEPMRTAAGASMMRSDAALPFKDIVRSYDFFTQSLITSMVQFNRKFNPGLAPEGDYNVIARGATSLIAKEIRGAQVDQLAATLTPEERDHVDERKFVEARFRVRDMEDMLVPESVATQRQAARQQQQAEQAEMQKAFMAAQTRETNAQSFKHTTQGQKNIIGANANQVETAVKLIEQGVEKDDAGNNKAAGGASRK